METKKIVICGATSGLGREIAMHYIEDGFTVGVIGRRSHLLDELKALCAKRVYTQVIDITSDEAPELLRELIATMGGMDVYVHVSGVGFQNRTLDSDIELMTLNTNCMGFTRMITVAFNYFAQHGGGSVAAVTSIAGTKGLGVSPSYSATKRFQSQYLQCLSQLSHIRGLNISFTDIRPGFVDTEMLGYHYPMLMKKEPAGTSAYRAIRTGKRIKIIDWRFAIAVFVWQLIPDFLWERLRVQNCA